MSGSGRGKFLSMLRAEAESVSGVSNFSDDYSKDSGRGTSTHLTAEIRPGGRGKLLEDLSSSFSQMSSTHGRGRAQLLDLYKEPFGLADDESSCSSPISGGAGRAQIFKHLVTSSVRSSISDVSTKIETTSEIVSQKSENGDTESEYRDVFYNPDNKRGLKGEPQRLACNYIRLNSDPNKGVFVYEVRFMPNVDSGNLRMKYLNEHRDKFGGTKTFDGALLFLPILLEKNITTFHSKNVADNSDIEVRILFKKKESLRNCMHLYNVLFDRVMKTLNYVRFDRKQFDPSAPKIIPQAKLEVWPGYVTAVDEYDGGLMLCCDVSHRLLCQKTVLDMLIEIYKSNSQKFQENAKKSLLGSVVITRYNNRTYRIDDVCFDKSPLSTFSTKTAETSYVDYYRNQHNITIKDLKQPLLLSIKKQRGVDKTASEDLLFCLIPELCYLTGLRDDMRSDYKLMREIATFTRVTPNQRLAALQKFYTNINNCPEAREILQNWGLTLEKSNETVTGRKLGEEQILFAKKQFGAGPTADFSKYAVSNELLDVVPLNNWLLIHCKCDSKVAKSFLDHMERSTKACGIAVRMPKIVVLDNDRVEVFVQALRSNINRELQAVVCICPTARDDRYSAIKRICCAEMPVPSQVINAKTLMNEMKNRSIVQKIALQINCKMGGSLWSVKIPFKNVMICGIDSYHDPAQKSNSVSAFVASLNHTYTKWFSKAVIQTKREEIVNGLCQSFTAALVAYQKVNGNLPDKVIIYRDGVGDGQLPLCSSHEIPQFEDACTRMFQNYRVKITFIVVQKRINTRYFVMNGANGSDNPAPGTVLDHTVTRKTMYDFFLVSQSVRQGTVSPTHFVVLREDGGFGPDIIQKLSYKLCFLYYNWPGTIRIPACCQYAHKMAYLVGQNIRRETGEELANKLFYL